MENRTDHHDATQPETAIQAHVQKAIATSAARSRALSSSIGQCPPCWACSQYVRSARSQRIGQAACDGSSANAAKFFGSGVPLAFAASLKCARREGGIPIDFQLWTVETGASIKRATAEVPPK